MFVIIFVSRDTGKEEDLNECEDVKLDFQC